MRLAALHRSLSRLAIAVGDIYAVNIAVQLDRWVNHATVVRSGRFDREPCPGPLYTYEPRERSYLAENQGKPVFWWLLIRVILIGLWQRAVCSV